MSDNGVVRIAATGGLSPHGAALNNPNPELRVPSAMDVVMAQVEAWASRDLERFMAFFSPACKAEDGQGAVLMDGAAAMREVYGPLFANSPNLRITVPSRIESGPYAMLEEDCGGMNLPRYPESIRCAVAYRVDDGVITSMRFLW